MCVQHGHNPSPPPREFTHALHMAKNGPGMYWLIWVGMYMWYSHQINIKHINLTLTLMCMSNNSKVMHLVPIRYQSGYHWCNMVKHIRSDFCRKYDNVQPNRVWSVDRYHWMTSRGLVGKPLRPQVCPYIPIYTSILLSYLSTFPPALCQHVSLFPVSTAISLFLLSNDLAHPPLHWNVHMCTQQTLFFIVRDDCDDNKAEQAWVALAH